MLKTRIKNGLNNHSAVIVVFGATGDLSRKKIFPALLHLNAEGFLPKFFRVVGVSRKDFSDEGLRRFLLEGLENNGHGHLSRQVDIFLKNVYYQKGAADDPQIYKNISAVLEKFDREAGVRTNKLFYLSVPSSSYEDILRNLSVCGLAGKNKKETRVLVEKPFGSDLVSAKKLDRKMKSIFDESQIFRIDHYLAKDAVQNILAFRFSNKLFESSWNRYSIEKVHLKLYENFGVEDRGSFYDSVGALRDVGQNHLLQMLALVAMDNPGSLEPDVLRKNRAKTLKALKKYSPGEVCKNAARFQYDGYKKINGVAKNSKTETYFMTRAFVDNERWRGVPFYMESGKNLDESRVEIEVFFKPAKFGATDLEKEESRGNILTLAIQPKQKVIAKFWVKRPGVVFGLEPQTLAFEYDKEANGLSRLPDAYEKVIYDCITDDQTLFVGSEEVEASWKFITPVLKAWQKAGGLGIYKPGQLPKVNL